jgi:hypothetical protein
MSVIQLELFKQSKQRQYMKRYRTRLDHFIKVRVPQDSGGNILRMAEEHITLSSRPDLVWDYVEMREIMLELVAKHVAAEIFDELQKQFWFDETFINKDMVAERCLSFMILGPAAMAAE